MLPDKTRGSQITTKLSNSHVVGITQTPQSFNSLKVTEVYNVTSTIVSNRVLSLFSARVLTHKDYYKLRHNLDVSSTYLFHS